MLEINWNSGLRNRKKEVSNTESNQSLGGSDVARRRGDWTVYQCYQQSKAPLLDQFQARKKIDRNSLGYVRFRFTPRETS